MPHITANDLKTKGISVIEAMLATQPEAIISVRGKKRFVVMNVERYHYLRECELEFALAQTRAELAQELLPEFRGSGKGGGASRLVAERVAERLREA